MTKINRGEYEVLKGLDDRWKWIARDDNYDDSLFCFENRPYKNTKSGNWDPTVVLHYKYFGEHYSKFQFIQWEDEEPYSIAELIEEFEEYDVYDYVGWEYHKSEESEMKKDILWAKIKIHEELDSWCGVEGGIDGDGINNVLNILDQLDESEVEQLYKKIRSLDSFNDFLMRSNDRLRNELYNQETLSQAWIDENHFETENWDEDLFKSDGETIDHTPQIKVIAVQDLQNAIVQKQELPVVPEFVFEDIKGYKDADMVEIGELFSDIFDETRMVTNLYKTSEWAINNQVEFAQAWLAYPNIVVEEEQKYIVSDNSSIPLLIKNDSGEIMSYDSQIAYNNSNGTIELTKKEIKSYDERYMTFAKPVEEIEK